MKKIVMLMLVLVMGIALAACGSDDKKSGSGSGSDDDDKKIDKLSIAFVPSRDPEEIITATEPLKELLKSQLHDQGYDVNEVEITVGTNYEAVGEALSAGTTDIGLIPGGTYVLYDDGAEVILTATRAGLSLDSDDPAEWNKNKPTEKSDTQANSYRALLIAGPSEKGRALADKVNNGEKLAFEDLDNVSWNVMSSSSPAGYIYPALWLDEHFGKTITDLSKVVQADSYGSAFARLAADQTDVLVTYADARIDFEENWTSEFDRKNSIWDETDVIGVMPAIYNDTVSVSKNSDIMNDDLKTALQKAFINIGNSEEGKEVIAIYSHDGYQNAKDSDYDNERKAQELVQELSSN
ncbi:phosphonate ABC transporter substrate-binding protein [Sporosarcina sp. BI001-red]|uniref:phosphate/phosphite/phosphonate ABC transporter substrate-binding protein n=1 Tax=Sporosarcina sp. BI001-red TaxID=2282866 RepID=UPI000E2698B3|nr:PhnD/SsuA/transferrin family substrate-binding protein [Sporosarcina sp. BI001-red]REB07071.1 phosphonate ABC transporter substrate-binding protein [Sporosarcina sp. BI001-red]